MRLFLHIGHMKTGTTAFQRLLAGNRGALEAGGFFYPAGGPRIAWQHGELLADAVRCGDTQPLQRLLAPRDGADTLILSGETLANVPTGAGRALCRWLAARCDLHVLYAVREWQHYLPSRYRQNLRLGDGWTFPEFIRASRTHFCTNPDHNYRLNIDEYRANDWQLHVLEYGPELIERLATLIGIPAGLLPDDLPRQNVADSFETAERERLINVAVNRVLERPQHLKFQSLLERWLLLPEPPLQWLRAQLRQGLDVQRLDTVIAATRREWGRPLRVGRETWPAFRRWLAEHPDIQFSPAPVGGESREKFAYSCAAPFDDAELRDHVHETLYGLVKQPARESAPDSASVRSRLTEYLAAHTACGKCLGKQTIC